MVLQNL